MCGITGWVDYRNDLRGHGATVEAMTETLRPRGPDSGGVWLSRQAALGHRRLAVIDPAGGAQPMADEPDGADRAVLVYSGEVYNYRTLRAQLEGHGHRFRTRSDTEVVLRAYLQWGHDSLARLVGMFAFALWDARASKLLLARDRLGIKPLYYARLPHGVVFGSEPKAIFASGLLAPAVDRQGLCQLLGTVKTPGEAVFSGMREVRPGHALHLTASGCHERRYWQLGSWHHRDDLRTTIATTRSLLEEVVGDQLVADVPLCALLSGGLDSSTLAVLGQRAMQRRGSCLATFSVTFAGDGGSPAETEPDPAGVQPVAGLRSDEDERFARQVAAEAAADHTTVVVAEATVADPGNWMRPLLARDLPPTSDADLSLFLLFQAVRRRATVAVSGEGADELFGGYGWFHDPEAVSATTFPWVAAARALGRFSLFEPAFTAVDVEGYQAEAYAAAMAAVPRLDGESTEEARRREISYFHLSRFVQNPLDRKDRTSMASGLEIRVPYCDHRLVEYVFNVPWSYKIFDGRPKSLLRAVASGRVPAAVLHRPKNAYPSLSSSSYCRHLQQRMASLMADRQRPIFDILNRSSLRALASVAPSRSEMVRSCLERSLWLNDWLEHYEVAVNI